MGQTATDVLFDELLKRPDDLDLFLIMHYGFQEIYENLCIEFFFDCLVPKLQNKVREYNAKHNHNLKLKLPATDKKRDFLARFGGLRIIAQNIWPAKLEVVLESNQYGCNNFLMGITLEDSEGDFGPMAGPFEQAFREYFKSVLSYQKGLKYVFCDYPNRNWNSREMFPALVKDVLARRSSEDAQCPTAGHYVEALMALVAITDKVVKYTCSGPALN